MGEVTTRAGRGELDIPKKTILTALAFIVIFVYFLFPIDLIPDVIPVWGFVDDLVITILGLFFIRSQW